MCGGQLETASSALAPTTIKAAAADARRCLPAAAMSKQNELPVTFDVVREKNLEQLKLLNSVIFPIKYQVQRHRAHDSSDGVGCALSTRALPTSLHAC